MEHTQNSEATGALGGQNGVLSSTYSLMHFWTEKLIYIHRGLLGVYAGTGVQPLGLAQLLVDFGRPASARSLILLPVIQQERRSLMTKVGILTSVLCQPVLCTQVRL